MNATATELQKAKVWLQEVDVNEAIESGAEKLRKVVRERPLASIAVGFIVGLLVARRVGR